MKKKQQQQQQQINKDTKVSTQCNSDCILFLEVIMLPFKKKHFRLGQYTLVASCYDLLGQSLNNCKILYLVAL